MTIFDSTAYEVSEETFEYAQKIAVNAKDENSRKRIYEALICLRTLAEYFSSEGYNIDLENNLFRIMPVNEELECNDLRGNGRCIDVRTVVNGKYILIPKTYYKYNVLPDLFAVAKYNSDEKTVNILGCIEPTQVEKQRQNEKYFIMDTSQLIQPFQIEDRIKLVKNTKISDQDHDLYASYFIDYCDGVLSEENKKKLFSHLFECKGCRERFADYYNCELTTKHSSEYPQILQDQMLSIVGATAVENEKYKDFEEITLEIEKEPDKYAEDEEDSAEDPLQVLYGKKGLNTDVFNSFKQKSLLPKDKRTKSMLDSVLADIPKLPINNTASDKSDLIEEAYGEKTDDTTIQTGKINPALYQEDYSDGIVYGNEDRDDSDYIEDIVTPEPDPAIYNKEDDDPLFLNELNPKTEKTTAVDEMLLLDAPVSPDISNFANFKKTASDVSDTDEEDVIIIDDEEDDNNKLSAANTTPSVLDRVISSVQSSKSLPDIQNDEDGDEEEDVVSITDDIKDDVKSELDNYENIDENDLVHFDVEDVDIVNEIGNKYVVDKSTDEQAEDIILTDDETSDSLEDEAAKEQNKVLLPDENEEKNSDASDNSENEEVSLSNDNIDIDFAEIKVDIGDENPMFHDIPTEIMSENTDSEIDIKPDENTNNIDDFLNSDLLNIGDIGDIDLALNSDEDKSTFEEPNSLDLSTNDLYSDIGEVIPNMYDITETPDKEQEVIANDDEDDEIILVDDQNKPIINREEVKNDDEDLVLIPDNDEKDGQDETEEDEEIVLISDDGDYNNNETFVRPASVSDLNSKFMLEDSEDSAKKDDIDALDDDVTFISQNQEEDIDEISFSRPAGAMYQNSPLNAQTGIGENNSQNINVLFGNGEEQNSENNEVLPNHPTVSENAVKFDEDGFEITDEPDNTEDVSVSQNAEEQEYNQQDFEEEQEEDVDGFDREDGAEAEETEESENEEYDDEYEDESEDDSEYEQAAEDEIPNNKNNVMKKAAVIALIVLVGLGSVGGGLFYYINKSKQEQMKNIAALNSLNEEASPSETSGENPDEGMNLSDDGIQLPAEGENNEIAQQMPPQENAAPEPEKLPEPPSVVQQSNDAGQPKSKDMNQAMTNAFSANPGELKVTKTSWAVAPYIVADADFKAFLQTSGRAIQAEIKKNLVSVRDNTYSENTKVQISINEGAIKDIVILKSSGSKQIDEIVLQSVKDYMANVQLPKLSETTVETIKKTNGNYSFKITLSVNF